LGENRKKKKKKKNVVFIQSFYSTNKTWQAAKIVVTILSTISFSQLIP